MSALDDLEATVKAALTGVGIGTAVIGVDVSFDEDLQRRFRPHWLIHVRALVPGLWPKRTIEQLRAKFPTSASISRPFRSAIWDGKLVALAYGMKPNFGRRQSYTQQKVTAAGTRNCRNTRGRPLTGPQAVEVALFLDRIGLRRRLILHGARLVRRNGTVQIVPGERARKQRHCETHR